MHSRILQHILRKQSAKLQSLVSSNCVTYSQYTLLKFTTTQTSALSLAQYSLDSSKNNTVFSDDIKLEDISVDVTNPAVDSIDYDAVTGGDEEALSKLKFIVLETDSLFQDGVNVPSKIDTEDWKHMLSLPSRSQRIKYLDFKFKKEMKKINHKARKEANRLTTIEKSAETKRKLESTEHIFYGLQGNTLFHRLYDSYFNKIDNHRAMNSIQLGPDIIIDCDYYDYQNKFEQKMLGKQLLYVLSENRLLYEPYNVIFTGFDKESYLAEHLNHAIPNLYTDEFPFNYTEKSFLDLPYDRRELVYLTPHTNNVLLEHKPGSVYVIGGMVDKRIQQPISLAKAKKAGIRSAKLPLDNFLDWGTGHKSLTINQVIAIMNDWRITNDWSYSFRHIPRRKLFRDEAEKFGYLSKERGETDGDIAKTLRQRKKRQLMYDLLLKR